jgi:hypothetical protein
MTDSFDHWVDDALGLFEIGAAERPPPPMPQGVWGALGTKWTRFKGVHQPCVACTELIHQLGVGKAPHPQPASWKRTGPNGDRLLCNEHGEEHRRLDSQVTAQCAADAAQRDHANRGR